MKIGVFGLGTVGSAVKNGFEEHGYDVLAYDPEKDTFDKKEVIKNCNILLVCVPTPNTQGGSNDATIVEDVCEDIEHIAEERKIVAIKSTVMPGKIEEIQKNYSKHSFLANPEFLYTESADEGFIDPEFIVIGHTHRSRRDVDKLKKVYESFGAPIKVVGCKEAMTLKYMLNLYSAVNVIFTNQMNDFCEEKDIEFENVRDIFKEESRVGEFPFEVFHKGSRGFEGPCIPKDLKAFKTEMSESGINNQLFEIVDSLNKEYLER